MLPAVTVVFFAGGFCRLPPVPRPPFGSWPARSVCLAKRCSSTKRDGAPVQTQPVRDHPIRPRDLGSKTPADALSLVDGSVWAASFVQGASQHPMACAKGSTNIRARPTRLVRCRTQAFPLLFSRAAGRRHGRHRGLFRVWPKPIQTGRSLSKTRPGAASLDPSRSHRPASA